MERDAWFHQSLAKLLKDGAEGVDFSQLANVKKVAKTLANEFSLKVLSSRSWNDFQNPVPVMDLLGMLDVRRFVVHDKVDNDSQKKMGLVKLQDSKWDIFIHPQFPEGSGMWRFTLAHEIAHILLRKDQKSWNYIAWNEEKFCDTFAACHLLPDKGVVPLLGKAFSLYQFEEIVQHFQVPPGLLLDWLVDRPQLLFQANKGLIYGESKRVTGGGIYQ